MNAVPVIPEHGNLLSSADNAGDRNAVLLAAGTAVALLLGRALLWLLVQLLKFLVLLAIVGTILLIGFEIGSTWQTLSSAAAVTEARST